MSFANQLETLCPSCIEYPASVADIPAGVFFVYVLTIDDQPIIVGHGKKNRAQIIFDSVDSITPNHIKAMTVRLYTLFGGNDSVFARYLIRCGSKEDAKKIEAMIHRDFGGNSLKLPDTILHSLFQDLAEDSDVRMILRMALCSSFDGIADLKRWRREGILRDPIWRVIKDRLKLQYDK